MGSWEVMLLYLAQESLVMKVSLQWLLERRTQVLFVIISLPTSPLCPQLVPLSIPAENKCVGTAFKDSFFFFNVSGSLGK